MTILYHPKFVREFKSLPQKIKDTAIEREKIFRENLFDPRLKTHKLHGELDGYSAFSVTHAYRIIFDFAEGGVARFYTIGGHKIYE